MHTLQLHVYDSYIVVTMCNRNPIKWILKMCAHWQFCKIGSHVGHDWITLPWLGHNWVKLGHILWAILSIIGLRILCSEFYLLFLPEFLKNSPIILFKILLYSLLFWNHAHLVSIASHLVFKMQWSDSSIRVFERSIRVCRSFWLLHLAMCENCRHLSFHLWISSTKYYQLQKGSFTHIQFHEFERP